MREAAEDPWRYRIAWDWVAACVALLLAFAAITALLVVWCAEGLSNIGSPDALLIGLALAPLGAWGLSYRLAPVNWPQPPARLTAATFAALAVAVAALGIRAISSGGV